MPTYKFSDIATNVTEKRMPVPEDRHLYIAPNNLETETLTVPEFGYKVDLNGTKLVMHKGDMLFGRREPQLKHAAIAPHDGLFSAHGMIFHPKENVICKEFFPFFISSDYFFDEAIRIAVGSLSPTVNWKDLKDVEFTLPNLDEQKRLAKILWAIVNSKKAYKEIISASDELVKSQFIEMFYGKGYPVKTIGEVIDKNIVRVAKVFGKTDLIQYLDISSIDNVSREVIGLTPYTLSNAPSRAQYVLKQGDILFSTVRPNLQNIAINPYNDDNIIGSTGFCVLRCLKVRTGYMWGVVNSTLFTTDMVKKASGANYPAVTDKVVHAYKIPIPPEEAQIAYEQFIQQSDKSKFEAKKAIEELNSLQKKILLNVFGEQ